MTRPALVLVTGSRALAGNADARAWLRARLDALAPAVLVTGDARGPDAWALEWAASRGATWWKYALDGAVESPGASGIWSAGAVPPLGSPARLKWPLRRNDAMVREVAKVASHYAVTVLALTSGASRTGGTAYTVGRAKAAGLAVVPGVWP